MRSRHHKNVFLGYINVNLLGNKFESLNELIKDTFHIFLVSESKLPSSFPDSQFSIPGYRIVRKDRNKNGGGIIFYINEVIPFKVIESKQLPGNLEILKLEIILDKRKDFLMGLYKPLSFNGKDFLFHLINAYNSFCTTYENITLICDFNMIQQNKKLSDFYEMNKFEHLILKPTCFKGLLTFTIGLLLTKFYEIGCVTGVSKTVFYRCYKNFDQDSFNETLLSRISLPNLLFKNYLRYFTPH